METKISRVERDISIENKHYKISAVLHGEGCHVATDIVLQRRNPGYDFKTIQRFQKTDIDEVIILLKELKKELN